PVGARQGRAPAPAGALVPRAGRGGAARRDPRPGAVHAAAAADRPAPRRCMTVDALAARRDPSRPGPGPLPGSVLRALDLTIGRRVEGLLAGDYRSSRLGPGTELAQVRVYEPG